MEARTHSISEIANLYGISLRSLRFYEQIGLLNPERLGTSRWYRAKDLIVLELILKGKKLGFSLKEIETLIFEVRNGQTAASADATGLRLHQGQIEERLKILERQKLTIDLAIDELNSALSRKPT